MQPTNLACVCLNDGASDINEQILFKPGRGNTCKLVAPTRYGRAWFHSPAGMDCEDVEDLSRSARSTFTEPDGTQRKLEIADPRESAVEGVGISPSGWFPQCSGERVSWWSARWPLHAKCENHDFLKMNMPTANKLMAPDVFQMSYKLHTVDGRKKDRPLKCGTGCEDRCERVQLKWMNKSWIKYIAQEWKKRKVIKKESVVVSKQTFQEPAVTFPATFGRGQLLRTDKTGGSGRGERRSKEGNKQRGVGSHRLVEVIAVPYLPVMFSSLEDKSTLIVLNSCPNRFKPFAMALAARLHEISLLWDHEVMSATQ
ncbi:hypothetical protein L210DRAFT_3505358 [Boletus edulis BED1]|uniref:Uncharacterized protein n=1 Tax=Boletus edulis BED1 TaxID=1328754 RepID=A0AAD4BRC5_BOLED|nr:hypothetical protein L210DRAFT_3505358 [Boletus edulis BED1]